jgi:thioredoxin 1
MKEITTYEQFQEVISSEKPVIVKFGAPWCGPCKMLDPVLDEVDKSGLPVYKITIDNKAVAQVVEDYGVMGIPVTIGFANGQKIKKHIGLANAEQIKALIW